MQEKVDHLEEESKKADPLTLMPLELVDIALSYLDFRSLM